MPRTSVKKPSSVVIRVGQTVPAVDEYDDEDRRHHGARQRYQHVDEELEGSGPSMRAASSNSSGTDLKSWRK